MIHAARRHWVWRALAAGLCGTIAHSLLMLLKSWAGWLPTFQPYQSLQQTISSLIGSDVHPLVPWLFSFFSGATIVGFLFGQVYRVLPGKSGASKGFVFGLLGWAVMGLVFFPSIGLGVFAANLGLGVAPAVFALGMLLTYSVVMGLVYAALEA